MKALKIIGIVLVALAVVTVGAGLALPSRWHAERSAVVNAAMPAIYPFVAGFKNGWSQWSAFGPLEDPTMKMSYSGPELGAGAVQTWTSEKKPPGSTAITEADPAKGVHFELVVDGGKFSFAGQILLEPAAGGTKVTWAIGGDLGGNPLQHLLGPVFESSIGKAFEASLATLKQKVEAAPPKPATAAGR